MNTEMSDIDVRMKQFELEDIDIGVRATSKGIFVPHNHQDRMNAVAFYVALKNTDYVEGCHGRLRGYFMSRDDFVATSDTVASLINPLSSVYYADENQAPKKISRMTAALQSKLRKLNKDIS